MDNQLPPYKQLQDFCESLSEPVNISGVHGSISAMLSVNSSTTLSSCLRQYGDGELSDNFLTGYQMPARVLESLYQSIHYGLNETDFSYQLYLPDEDDDIAKRLKALSCWCDDFLMSFGVAYSASSAGAYSEEVRKLLSDFAEFSRVDWYNTEEDEGSEFDYQQIIEFVRMGVIHIHSDFHLSTTISTSSDVVPN